MSASPKESDAPSTDLLHEKEKIPLPPTPTLADTVMSNPIPLEGEDVNVLVCMDGHDKTRHGAGDMLQWMLIHQPHMHPRWNVCLFGHVHNNSSIPLVHSIGKALGSTTDRSEREQSLRKRIQAIEDIIKTEPSVKVQVMVDNSENKMNTVYTRVVEHFSPHFIFINERTDSDDWISPFGTESTKLNHKLTTTGTSIVVCKSRVSSTYDYGGNTTMHFILLVDQELSASSMKALESLRAMLPEGGGGSGLEQELSGDEDREAQNGVAFVSVLCCWETPDVATAVYSTEQQWEHEQKKRKHLAKKSAKRTLAALRTTHPNIDATVHTSHDSVTHAVNKIIRVVEKAEIPAFHNIVVGGGRSVIDKDGHVKKRSHSLSKMVGLAKRRVFGSTADSLVSNVNGNGAVTIAY